MPSSLLPVSWGPQSNAHGPNEFLDLPTVRRVTCVLSQVLADHYHASLITQGIDRRPFRLALNRKFELIAGRIFHVERVTAARTMSPNVLYGDAPRFQFGNQLFGNSSGPSQLKVWWGTQGSRAPLGLEEAQAFVTNL